MINNLIKLIKIFDYQDQFKLIIIFLMTIIAMGLSAFNCSCITTNKKILSPEQNFDFLNKINFFSHLI